MDIKKFLNILTLPVLLSLGGTAVAVQASQNAADESAPLACDILAETHRGVLSIQGLVMAEMPLEGAFQLKVKSVGGSNRTNIVQGGSFATNDDGEAEIGNVTLGSSTSSYAIEFSVSGGGLDATCKKTVELRA